MTKYSESSTKSSFFTISARLLVSKLPLQRNKDSQNNYMFKNLICLVSFQCLIIQHSQKDILPTQLLLAEQTKCPYMHFISHCPKSLKFLSVAPLLCVISLFQIRHMLKWPTFLFRSYLKPQQALKPLTVDSSIWSLRVITNLVQIYIQNVNKNLKQCISSWL